ncbi:MAG: hypothetical protein NXH85_04635 [Pseudomonadaceae bacterium]|nr:hypothetical protein [Pseudomonadaceae bacterium]
MKENDIKAFAAQGAKSIKTEANLDAFRQMLTKATVEAALNAELEDHLEKQEADPDSRGDSRNGYSPILAGCACRPSS